MGVKVVPEKALEKRLKKNKAEGIIWSLCGDLKVQSSVGERRLERWALLKCSSSCQPTPSHHLQAHSPSCRCLTTATWGETQTSPLPWPPWAPRPAAAGADGKAGSHPEGTAATAGASASPSLKTFWGKQKLHVPW